MLFFKHLSWQFELRGNRTEIFILHILTGADRLGTIGVKKYQYKYVIYDDDSPDTICVLVSFFFPRRKYFHAVHIILSLLIIVQSLNSRDCNVYINNAFAEKNILTLS